MSNNQESNSQEEEKTETEEKKEKKDEGYEDRAMDAITGVMEDPKEEEGST